MDITDKDKIITDRVKKLTEALYRVTDLYPDREPLKWALRESSLSIYTNLMSIMSDRNFKNFGGITKDISNIINTLDLASLGGFISDINFEILKREYSSLKSMIDSQKELVLIEQKIELEQPQKKIVAVSDRVSDTMSDRKSKIMDIISKEGKKTIKEILPIFDNISEKSVQRDLLELVKSGKLITEGEKRWRAYSITQI
ncbi:MAG: hypothetical protein WC587_03525 [Candidatus Paceibacterota bacterium]